MPPSADLSYTYTTEADVQALLSIVGEQTRLDDDGYGFPNSTEDGYLDKIIQWATARVNLHCLSKYPAADLASSWIVNDWCTIVACYILCCRRGNPPSGAIKEMYDAALEDMKAVQRGEVTLPDTALRNAGWPAWSNLSHIDHYRYKSRVQTSISEKRGGSPDYQQRISHADERNTGPFS